MLIPIAATSICTQATDNDECSSSLCVNGGLTVPPLLIQDTLPDPRELYASLHRVATIFYYPTSAAKNCHQNSKLPHETTRQNHTAQHSQ